MTAYDATSPLQGPAGAELTASIWALPPSPSTPHSLERLTRYARYLAWFAGEQWEDLPAPGERRLTFNYLRIFIVKAASYLVAHPVGYDARPLLLRPGQRRDHLSRQVEDFISRVVKFNALPALDLETAIAAAVIGDGAWTVRWDGRANLPRITRVEPAGLDARWRGDDLRTLLWVRQQYWVMPAELSPAAQARLVGPYDPYQQLRACEEWTPAAWRLLVQGTEVDGGPNPYGLIPYVIFPNQRVPGEFWGEGDLVDLLRIQRELNSRLSIFSRLLEIAGSPVAVVTGADGSVTEQLRMGPGELWTLPPGAKAEVLELLRSGAADAHFKYIDLIYRILHDLSEMPRTSFGDSAGTARSGVAIQLELQPLLHKLARKYAALTLALVERMQLCLAMARVHGYALPAVDLVLQWPPVLPQDRSDLVSQETALVQAGIHPVTTAMSALGDADPEALFEEVLSQAARLQQSGLLARPRPAPDTPPDAPATGGV